MCKVVRDVVAADFGQEVADKVRVQYGGSVKPENVADCMVCPDVDGALCWWSITSGPKSFFWHCLTLFNTTYKKGEGFVFFEKKDQLQSWSFELELIVYREKSVCISEDLG